MSYRNRCRARRQRTRRLRFLRDIALYCKENLSPAGRMQVAIDAASSGYAYYGLTDDDARTLARLILWE